MLEGDSSLSTLYHLRFRTVHAGEKGQAGEGSNRTGRSGKDLVIKVPLGTLAFNDSTGEPLGEILEEGRGFVLAKGGRGGRGNARFSTSTRQSPRYAQPGEAGVEREIRLELKLLADVGVIGLPNAGKSTFISAVSAARPKIADYPFTTLVPHLGVVTEGPDHDPFVIADLPGLIPGAAQGAGLGHQFLRHIERCSVLLHFVDLSAAEQPAADELSAVESELKAFNASLLDRPRVVVGTKLDCALADRHEGLKRAAAERALPYFEISAVSQENVGQLLAAIRVALTKDAA